MFGKKKTFVISERDPIYKVRYLGNVMTSFVRSDGCVDKPTQILWNNYVAQAAASNPSGGAAGLEMELTVCNSGLKVVTKEQGLTEYRAHRITYSVSPSLHPKLFVWVYKHEGRKMKSEVRCHAVLCKNEAMASAIAAQLRERIVKALDEFVREKKRRQNSRLIVKRSNSLKSAEAGCPGGGAVRTKFLNTGQNFKPSIDRSTSAPKLGSITEGDEEEELAREAATNGYKMGDVFEDDEYDDDASFAYRNGYAKHTRFSTGSIDDVIGTASLSAMRLSSDGDDVVLDDCIDMRPGVNSDGDNDSTESGFSEQDAATAAAAVDVL